MSDAKNRLVASYMGTIEHLQPPYLLIEQVGIFGCHPALVARVTCTEILVPRLTGLVAQAPGASGRPKLGICL